MTTASSTKPVLILGGYGEVGRKAAHALRELQHDLPITIAGRSAAKAQAFAEVLGNADFVPVDLSRPDLGLPDTSSYSAIITFFKDDTLNAMRFAQATGTPYVTFSDFTFDIGPEVALHAHNSTSAALVILGHYLGGSLTLAILHFAAEFKTVHEIAIGALLDAEDTGGPTAQSDAGRLEASIPTPLIRKDGRWLWANGDDAKRSFTGHDGSRWEADAFSLLDVTSLAASTGAASVWLGLAFGEPASRREGQGMSHEVVVEITGEYPDGSTGRACYDLIDSEGYITMSARGAALTLERLAGRSGDDATIEPGLYFPESLLDPAAVVERLKAFGTRIERR